MSLVTKANEGTLRTFWMQDNLGESLVTLPYFRAKKRSPRAAELSKGIELRGKGGWGQEVKQGLKVKSGDFRVIWVCNIQNDLKQVPSSSAALSPLICKTYSAKLTELL